MEPLPSALRAALLRPAPTWAFWAALACVVAGFVLAFAAFAYPLSYCDSPSWAPGYLARLAGTGPLVSAKQRGLLVPAWFELWGELSIATGFANLIGFAQAVALAATACAVLVYVRRGMTRAEALVLPAFVLSGLRHAVYSQTLLSESVVIPLGILVTLIVLREGTLSLRQCALAASLAALAASARIESLLLFPVLLLRIATDHSPWRERARAIALTLGVGVAAHLVLVQLS